MDNITHEIRIANWKEIITKCNDRAEGLTAAQWLKENDIPRDSYYYWLRRVRKESITQLIKMHSQRQNRIARQ